jgi:hypothetical protein
MLQVCVTTGSLHQNLTVVQTQQQVLHKCNNSLSHKRPERMMAITHQSPRIPAMV